ncbi:DeoR/GlpR family DNA-binding transcription regulator [Gordonia sp. VNK21]|uniref:DeoR/GlpR family DNA-binding transcription regulator n=1 Tax=Gordonia sp. VNK21 TaxID=3382483 RepID=UPI0038D3964E
MYAEERQQAIANEVRERGRVSVAELSHRFDVTGETVRRDLAVLAQAGQVTRVHGGAVRTDVGVIVDEADLPARQRSHQPEKKAIGAAALELLPPSGGTVLFDAGTTTHQAASALAAAQPADTRLTLVTNSLPIAATLTDACSAGAQRREVLMTGGRLRPKTQAAVGTATIEQLGRLRLSVGFLGTNGLSVRHGLSTPDPDEAAVKRAMIAAVDRVVVLADSSKINREDLVSFGDLDEVDVLITDRGIDAAFAAELAARDIEVVIA